MGDSFVDWARLKAGVGFLDALVLIVSPEPAINNEGEFIIMNICASKRELVVKEREGRPFEEVERVKTRQTNRRARVHYVDDERKKEPSGRRTASDTLARSERKGESEQRGQARPCILQDEC